MSATRIYRDLCLVYKYKKMTCNRCRERCPGAAIGEDLSINAACNDCGLCLAACPAEAIAGENYSPAALRKGLSGTAPLLFHCQKQNSSSDWPCLGFLDARLLVGLALNISEDRILLIDDSGCEHCRLPVKEQLWDSVGKANALLSYLDRPLIKTGACAQNINADRQPISRRHFFTKLFGAAIETVGEVVLPAAADPAPLKRSSFFARIGENELDLPDGASQQIFTAITVTDSCHACGLCEKVCPNQAIIIQKEDEAAIQLYHNPLLCTRCGVCASFCQQRAIHFQWAEVLKTHLVANVSLPQCRCCGNYYQPMGGSEFCLECKFQNHGSDLW
ncbi:MAG TPA: 4Fe-4S binding protein [Patescibacteria group bacterium]|nr:4Fe-4S binding protein [Patescibacteria group bacterium]